MSFERDLTDPLIKYLNSKGYMPIQVPRAGLLPPTVYQLEGDRYIRQADLVSWLELRPELQKLLATEPKSAADLENEMNAKKGGKASLKLFEKLASFFGGGTANLEASADAGNEVKFSYKGCTTREVLPDTIKTVLKSVPASRFGDALAEKKVHIACEYLYARHVEVSTKGSKTGGFNLGVGIPDAVKAGAEANAARTASDSTVWNSDLADGSVAIAFRVARITHADGKYNLDWDINPGRGMVPGAKPEPYLSLTGKIYEIVE